MPNSRSNPGQSGAGSQHLIQPQNTYKRFKYSLSCLCCGSRHHDTTPHVPAVDMPAPGIQEAIINGHASVVNVNPDVARAPESSLSTQGEGHRPLPIVEPVPVPVVTQFQGAQGFNVTGNTQFMNAGGSLTATVNNFGATHGLEKLEKYVSFAALHDSAEQDPYRRCHPGTRENVLGQLRHWIDNPNPTDRIFWLYGPAGAGKSAIAQTIAHGYKQGEVAATFFFYRSDSGRNDGNRLFTTIAWQLAFSIPAVKGLIVQALDKTPHLPMKDVETQFEQLVVHPMNNITSQMPQLAPVVIIDGVDECFIEQLQRRFLSVIGNTVKDGCLPLRFLICSRPEALIEETLNRFKDFTLRIDLATLDNANRDIEKYLVDQFTDIGSKQGLDAAWPGQEIIEEIVFKSSGNFILASTLVRFIGDEDHSAVTQLEIVRKLKPYGTMSPFTLLDELYLEILKRQLDQDFLKTFLALLVGRTSIEADDLHEDDAMLMNVSEKELHIKLRRMRSLFKFEPFIDAYHKSFLDFLQDSSRSDLYHVSKQDGQKQYLKLVVDSVIQHVSMAIEQPNRHEICRSSPKFKAIVWDFPPEIDLPVTDWQETSKPLLDLQHKLLNTSKLQPCHVTQIIRDLLMQLIVLQRNSDPIAIAEVPMSPENETVTETSATTEVRQKIFENDLDNCLSVLLSCLPKPNSVFVIDTVIIDHMVSLLAFDYTEVAARVRSVSNAQRLIDIIGLLTDNEIFLSRCGADVARKTAYLASEIFKRVPLLPRFPLIGRPFLSENEIAIELVFQSVLINRILDRNYVVPVSWIYYKESKMNFDYCNANEQNESVDGWLTRANPDLVTKIRVMLEIAKTIRYIHSMDVVFHSSDLEREEYFILDSNLRVKVLFDGFFAWWIRDVLTYGHEGDFLSECTYESNISAFAKLFHKVCFDNENILKQYPLRTGVMEDAKQLIERCRVEDPKSRPTIEDVVKEMESWKLT